MVNKNDDKILQLKEKITEKREKIGKTERFSPLTNCSLELDEIRYNLNVLSKNQLQQLLIKLDGLAVTANALSLLDDVEYSGYTLPMWCLDVKSKLHVLTQKEERRELNAMESKLDKMLSDEKQTELELDELARFLE